MRYWLFTMAWVGLTGAANAEPVSMVAHVMGKAEMRTGEKGAWKPLHLLQRLDPGDTIRCGPGAEAMLVQLAGGNRFQLRAGQQGVVQANTITGAMALGGLKGPSMQAAQALVGARTGNVLARPAQSHSRLNRQFPGWILADAQRFVWEPVPNAAAYTFTLLDTHEDILWSRRVTESETTYPADLPALDTRKPYLWRLTPFGQSGLPLAQSRWGVLTVLTPADADALTTEADALRKQAAETPADHTALALLAERYRSYGVLMMTLEMLEKLNENGEPGAQDAIEETYAELGGYAQLLAGKLNPKRPQTRDTP